MNFPYNVFNPFNNADLHWRFSQTFRYLCAGKTLEKIPSKPLADFTYSTLACRRDLPLAQTSIYTLGVQAERLPSLLVAIDESLSSEEIREALYFWPYNIEIVTRQHVALASEKPNNNLIAEFCRKHIFGYKLALCLNTAKSSRHIYADTDVLWHGDVCKLMQKYNSQPIYAGIDSTPSYDPQLVEKILELYKIDLLHPPFVNAGLAIYNNCSDLEEIIEPLLTNTVAQPSIHEFAEQSVVAALVKKIGNVMSPLDIEVSCNNMTLCQPSFKGKTWIARHYIRPVRSQFWLDAFWAIN